MFTVPPDRSVRHGEPRRPRVVDPRPPVGELRDGEVVVIAPGAAG
jgi:hypothetical protein